MHLRLILVALAVWLLVAGIRTLRGRKRRRAEAPRRLPDSEPMVRCARCGTFVPESRAVRVHGRTYCTEAHARPGADTPPRA